jgi:hypothetical protein
VTGMSSSPATREVWAGCFKSAGDGQTEIPLDIMIRPANIMPIGTPLELSTQTCNIDPDVGADLYKGEATQVKNIGFGVKKPDPQFPILIQRNTR